MRARIEKVDLVGTNRNVKFSQGLNILTGPIASGKTTLIRLCHGIFGTALDNFPTEVREHVAAIASRVILGDHEYSIVRPFATTKTAKVDISGLGEALRLPALGLDASATYTDRKSVV